MLLIVVSVITDHIPAEHAPTATTTNSGSVIAIVTLGLIICLIFLYLLVIVLVILYQNRNKKNKHVINIQTSGHDENLLEMQPRDLSGGTEAGASREENVKVFWTRPLNQHDETGSTCMHRGQDQGLKLLKITTSQLIAIIMQTLF